MMPNCDPRDGFFYATLTHMIDSYTLKDFKNAKIEIHEINNFLMYPFFIEIWQK